MLAGKLEHLLECNEHNMFDMTRNNNRTFFELWGGGAGGEADNEE